MATRDFAGNDIRSWHQVRALSFGEKRLNKRNSHLIKEILVKEVKKEFCPFKVATRPDDALKTFASGWFIGSSPFLAVSHDVFQWPKIPILLGFRKA